MIERKKELRYSWTIILRKTMKQYENLSALLYKCKIMLSHTENIRYRKIIQLRK